jgi:hypothetical protein
MQVFRVEKRAQDKAGRVWVKQESRVPADKKDLLIRAGTYPQPAGSALRPDHLRCAAR